MKKTAAVRPLHVFFLLTIFFLQDLVSAGEVGGLPLGSLLYLATGACSVLPVFFLFYIGKETGWNNPFAALFGETPGARITDIAAIGAVGFAAGAVRSFTDFMVVNELNTAGRAGNVLLIGAAIFVLLLGDRPILFHTAWIFQPLIMSALLVNVAITLPHAKLENLPPFVMEDKGALLRAAAKQMLLYVPPAIYPIFLAGKEQGTKKSAVLLACPVACLLLFILHARDGAVLGYPTIGIFRYPVYVAAGIRRHSEVLISSVFALCQTFYAAVCLRFVVDRLRERRPGKETLSAAGLAAGSVLFSMIPTEAIRQFRLFFGAGILLLVAATALAVFFRVYRSKRGI